MSLCLPEIAQCSGIRPARSFFVSNVRSEQSCCFSDVKFGFYFSQDKKLSLQVPQHLSRVPHFRTRQVHCTKAQSCSSKRSKFSTLPSWRKENKQTKVLSLNAFFTRRHRSTAILFHNLLEAEHSSIYTHFQSNAVIKVAPTPNYN